MGFGVKNGDGGFRVIGRTCDFGLKMRVGGLGNVRQSVKKCGKVVSNLQKVVHWHSNTAENKQKNVKIVKKRVTFRAGSGTKR